MFRRVSRLVTGIGTHTGDPGVFFFFRILFLILAFNFEFLLELGLRQSKFCIRLRVLQNLVALFTCTNRIHLWATLQVLINRILNTSFQNFSIWSVIWLQLKFEVLRSYIVILYFRSFIFQKLVVSFRFWFLRNFSDNFFGALKYDCNTWSIFILWMMRWDSAIVARRKIYLLYWNLLNCI